MARVIPDGRGSKPLLIAVIFAFWAAVVDSNSLSKEKPTTTVDDLLKTVPLIDGYGRNSYSMR